MGRIAGFLFRCIVGRPFSGRLCRGRRSNEAAACRFEAACLRQAAAAVPQARREPFRCCDALGCNGNDPCGHGGGNAFADIGAFGCADRPEDRGSIRFG